MKLIGKVKKLDKWVPHKLTEDQKNYRYKICSGLLFRNKYESFLNRIITCDEKWISYDNLKRSGQWLDKHEAPKHCPKPSIHQKKIMVTVWWCSGGIIHYNFLQKGCTITAETYCSKLNEMHKKLIVMCPALVNRKGPLLLHDNARPHCAKMTLHKINELGYEIVDHPPYSPDISPTDYHLFKHLELFLRGRQFKNEDEVKIAFTDFLGRQTKDFYQKGIYSLTDRWQKCCDADGSYFD